MREIKSSNEFHSNCMYSNLIRLAGGREQKIVQVYIP